MYNVLFKNLNFFTCVLITQPHITSMLCQTSQATALFLLELTITDNSLILFIDLFMYLLSEKQNKDKKI